ncbi:amino acid permease [Lasallia pustulata]|uniref:Amino acid permease n=1 Tax=Lasallia pustulata TaxID=136370 RepID=A0A1W5CVS7_9LECA|nr:amino acid permease [Lasallia pustulata]
MQGHARANSTVDDDAQLAQLGHKAELHRNFSPLAMLGLAFAILNSWTALSASLSLALPSGGPTSVIWGLVTAGVCNLCLAASMAEFLSAYPTAGGQYHWVAVISWKNWVPILSWITGWINVSGWIALVASGGLLGSQLIVGIIGFMNPAYAPQRWHQFLIYIGYNLVAFLINAFLNSALPVITKAAFTWSIAGFVIISITVLACASPDYSSASFVFREFINETGWPDGIAWLLGLLQAGLGLTGYDAVAHMIEEIPNPSVEGPRIMLACVGIGTFTGFVFLTVLLFVAGNVDEVISSTAGPLLQIFFNATQSRAGAICLLIFPLVCLLFATISIMTTSSRMTYAFARDGGLPASRWLARVHPILELPLNALYLTTVLVVVFGCIFLGSSSAFNAIISASVVALGVSYGIPIAINCLRGRRMLPHRAFALPGPLGWIANLIGLVYVIVTTVLFVFPPDLPVTGSNMNYCIVAFFIVLVISTITWFVDGRRNFTGPRINLDDLANGVTVGILTAGTGSHESGSNGYAKCATSAPGRAKFADEDDLPVGLFGRGELENQVYDPRKRVNHNRPKKL